MKFKKFGKALLLSALTAGVVFSVSSCVQSYSVGYLYVTGTTSAAPNGNGIVSGFKIDHNTGKLVSVPGLPVSTGGAHPVRAVLMDGSRFLYVLNKGVAADDSGNCATADPCKNSNIVQFSVGGNGVLSQQETFYPQGKNPMRMIPDSSGNYVMLLDHDAPDSYALTGKSSASLNSCQRALGSSVTSCGAIEVYSVNESTGRLQIVVNAQVSSASGKALPYFPVPANPIDFIQSGGYAITLFGTPKTGDYVFPYTYASGQLTLNQNSSQPLGVYNATAMDYAGNVYVLANDKITYQDNNGNTQTAVSQILPFSIGTGGSLQSLTGGAKPDDPSLANPIQVILESKNKWLYLANAGNNETSTSTTTVGIAGYTIDKSTNEPTLWYGQTFGAGDAPACILEDPSNQFIYTANFNNSTVTGWAIDENNGGFKTPTKPVTLNGPATWCLVSGRTS